MNMTTPVTAIVGAQWGDEGKGKMTDCLAEEVNERDGYVVRFQGGSNAGHTIINDYGKFALHLLPSGVFYPNVTNVLGNGVAVNMRVLLDELATLSARGVPTPRLKISDRAQVVMPYHTLLDECEEERLGASQFGSTKQGIAPFYADKALKIGIQVSELFDTTQLTARVEQALAVKNVLLTQLYGRPALDAQDIVTALQADAQAIEPYVCDTSRLLQKAIDNGNPILLEGQLGTLRDLEHGIYPYSTSSSPLAGFGSVGAGIPPYAIQRIVAVVKAYSSSVGAGPFVTALAGDEAETLRRLGGDAGEYGATTGRPRGVGWFDAVAARYGCRVQGATEVALTNLDVLGYLDEIPICTGYRLDGEVIQTFPTTSKLAHAQPVYEMMAGWQCEIGDVRTWADLPELAQRYVERVEALLGVPVKWISIGPKRGDLIIR